MQSVAGSPAADPASGSVAGGTVAPAGLPAFDLRRVGGDVSIVRQSYRVGPLGLLVAFTGAFSLEPVARVFRIPHARSCLLGLTNVRGRLTPLFDLAPVFGVQRTSGAGRYMLVIDSKLGTAGILVDGVPGTIRLGAADAITCPQVSASLAACVIAAYRHGDMNWLELDHQHLLATLKHSVAVALAPGAIQ